jgi:PAS domain S-box-containing protein
MGAAKPPRDDGHRKAHEAGRPPAARPGDPVGPDTGGSLLETLGVAAVVLDDRGRVALWSPQAQELFGYGADEVLGRRAETFMVEERMVAPAVALFDRVMRRTGSWTGVFPVRHKDGGTRLVEFRTMRLNDRHGERYALGLAAEEATVRRAETGIALSVRLVSQSPIGLAVVDTDLRFVSVNPALVAINGVPEHEHIGRTCADVLPDLDNDTIAATMREVLDTGKPLVDQHVLGRTPADPDTERAWSCSFYRLDGSGGRVLGLAVSILDITERFRATTEAALARQRLSLIAEASHRIGTTLDLERTAHELAELCVPALADVAAVHVLDGILHSGRSAPPEHAGPRAAPAFRAIAVASAHPTLAERAADPPGELAAYGPGRLLTRCATTGNAILVPHVTPRDLTRIARDADAAELLAEAGVHSYLAVPLIARGEVLGTLALERVRNPLAFTKDDQALAVELAARAAVSIDNARWYRNQRHAALTLQHHLLPHQPPERPGLEIAYRYRPAEGPSQVGGDWFDVISLSGDRTALVVGDVMGSGINAAATMGQVRTATRTLAELDLDPAEVLGHLDHITAGLERGIATCLYAVHDPRTSRLRVATAGHLPPALVRPGHPPSLLDLPTGAPLGVGGVSFEVTEVPLAPGDVLVMYTDGLVENRDQSLDVGLRELLSLLPEADRPLQETCDLLLGTLRRGRDPDDVVLLMARLAGARGG